MSVLEVRGLKKSFGDFLVLNDVNLSVENGEVISIIGASGCGKSVFIRLIEMLEKPDSGSIFVDGHDITADGADINKIRKSLGMVYQDFALFSNMNVMDNLCVAPVKLLGISKNEAESKALEMLESVGLISKAYSK